MSKFCDFDPFYVMFGWVQVLGKVLDLKLKVSRVRWNSVEVDMWYRLLRIDAGG